MSKMPRHLVALDVDGTLFASGEETVPQLVVEVIKAVARNHTVILASGRSLSQLEGVYSQLDFRPQFHIVGGGSAVLDHECKELVAHALPVSDIVSLKQAVFSAEPADHWCLGETEWQPLKSVNLDARVFALSFRGNNQAHADKIITALRDFHNSFTVTTVSSTEFPDHVNVMITHSLANKGVALKMVANDLLIEPENVVAIGDMPIDIPMLEFAGISVAMGQAPETVKAKAKIIAPSIDSFGAAWALKKIFQLE